MYSYDRRYAAAYGRMMLSMSMDDAKAVLGFPPGSNPSPSEVTKAYKAKSFIHHPDRGGDPKQMLQVNVAKAILDGKVQNDRTPYSPPKKSPEEEHREKVDRDRRVIDGAMHETVRAVHTVLMATDITKGRLDLKNFLVEEYADVLGKIHDEIDANPEKHRDWSTAAQLCHNLQGLTLRLARKFDALKKRHDLLASDFSGTNYHAIESLYLDVDKFIAVFDALYVESGKLSSLIVMSENVPMGWDDIYHHSRQVILSFRDDFKHFSERPLDTFKKVLEESLGKVEKVLSGYGVAMPDRWDEWKIPSDFMKAAQLIK